MECPDHHHITNEEGHPGRSPIAHATDELPKHGSLGVS
jgi:hypothetical protein